jgi:hypothetical protein
MNKLTTQIIILILLFLFPSVSFSQTFKCEFVSEKFKGGKSNEGRCSGDPETVFKSKFSKPERTEHCVLQYSGSTYDDYLDFRVNLEKKTVSYNQVRGITTHKLNESIEYFKRNGRKTEEEVREMYDKQNKMFSGNSKGKILSVNTHINTGMLEKGSETTQYLIIYKEMYLPNEQMYSLFIPDNGKSILTWYNFNNNPDYGRSSWIDLRFGKCVNTSK